MRKIMIAIGCIVTFTFITIRCGNTEDGPKNSTIPEITQICVGEWVGGLGGNAFEGLFGLSFVFNVKINNDPDSTYNLMAQYFPSYDTALIHDGNWSLNNQKDSIILSGSNCRIIDTTTHEVVQRDCGDPFPIYINISNNAWTVKATDLLPVAATMKVDLSYPGIIDAAQQLEIKLIKQE